MENKKGSEIFLGVVGVATLLVAIIGATFAYFSASATSSNQAIAVESAELALGYADDIGGLNTDLIPSESKYALYAGTNAQWIAKKVITTDGKDLAEDESNASLVDGQKVTGKGECIDQNGNEVCSVYTFTIGNPNLTTTLDITGEVFTTVNEFANLKFAIYDELNNQVCEKKDGQADKCVFDFPLTANGTVKLPLDQTLIPSSSDIDEDTETGYKESFNPENPTTFTSINDMTKTENAGKTNNRRTYRMIIWIEEIFSDQTEVDSGMMFSGGITFSTGSEKGVTGLIAVAG